jgi:hypothetical protein
MIGVIMKVKVTRRIYTFSVNGETKQMEDVEVRGGSDLMLVPEAQVIGEAKKKFGTPDVTLQATEDKVKVFDVDFPDSED